MNDDLTSVDRFGPRATPLDDSTLDAARVRLSAVTAAAGTRPAAPRRLSRRRTLLVGGTFIAMTSIGVAAAAEVLDLGYSSFAETFSHWGSGTTEGGRQLVAPSTAERAATAPGPDGTVFSVLRTPGEYACYTSVLETKASSAEPLPTSFVPTSGNWCDDEPIFEDFEEFGGLGVSFSYRIPGVDLPAEHGLAAFDASAGDAVRAEVTTPTGKSYPALLVDGMFWGWFPGGEAATLVGYAADGSVVGREYLGRGNVPGAPSDPDPQHQPQPR